MKNISIKEQRILCNAYKKARMNEANNYISFCNTGTYIRDSTPEIMSVAKKDILKFVSVFEDKIIEEITDELFR